jgi:hypothetical protein
VQHGRVKVEAWAAKLNEECFNLEWKRNRNVHAKLLLSMTETGDFTCVVRQQARSRRVFPSVRRPSACTRARGVVSVYSPVPQRAIQRDAAGWSAAAAAAAHGE